MTIADLLHWGRARLGGGRAGLVDAEVLLSRCTGRCGASLLADARRRVNLGLVGNFKSLVERRASGEPVAYLSGQREFWSLELGITPDVLIPRAESELLVERVLAHAARRGRDVTTLLELGTGSGAIALALASELPHCAVVATDISPAALEVAERNRRELALGGVEFRLGDWFEAVAARRFDMIVSNPPYLAPDDDHLRQGDLRFEPKLALVSPPDGLADLAAIIANAPAALHDGGMLLLEHGHDQAAAVREMFARAGFASIASHRDLGGNERITEGEGEGEGRAA